MSAAGDDGFFSRWSRRKAEDTAQAQAAERAARPAVPTSPSVPASRLPAGAGSADSTGVAAKGADAQADPVPGTAPASPPSGPTLDDVRSLNADSDFKPFVGRAVAPDVRNAAMKKLFADPHFNVMDGLDIYIDDYTQPDPLPASMLKQMASAKFLRLVEDEPEVPAGAPPAGAQPVAEGSADGAAEQPRADVAEGDVAQSDACKDLPMSAPLAEPTGAPADAHPDLRLQPDDAARCEADRPGAA